MSGNDHIEEDGLRGLSLFTQLQNLSLSYVKKMVDEDLKIYIFFN